MEILGGGNCVGNSRDQGEEIAIVEKKCDKQKPCSFFLGENAKKRAKVEGK